MNRGYKFRINPDAANTCLRKDAVKNPLMRLVHTSRLLLSFTLLIPACATERVFIQKSELFGMQSQPPLLFPNNNERSDLTIVPRISFEKSTIAGLMPGHSPISENGFFEVDTVVQGQTMKFFEKAGRNVIAFRGRNFAWTLPAFCMFTDIDYALSKHWSLVAGFALELQAPRSSVGYCLGIGCSFGGANFGGRIDGGIHWTSTKSKVTYLVTFRTVYIDSTQVDFFDEAIQSNNVNVYGALLLSMRLPQSPVLVFSQIAFNRQTFYSFRAPVDRADRPSVSLSMSNIFITPGVAIELSKHYRILVGVRFRYDLTLESRNRSINAYPLFGCEISL